MGKYGEEDIQTNIFEDKEGTFLYSLESKAVRIMISVDEWNQEHSVKLATILFEEYGIREHVLTLHNELSKDEINQLKEVSKDIFRFYSPPTFMPGLLLPDYSDGRKRYGFAIRPSYIRKLENSTIKVIRGFTDK